MRLTADECDWAGMGIINEAILVGNASKLLCGKNGTRHAIVVRMPST